MGTTCDCIVHSGGLDASNYIAISGIVINALFAGYIIIILQSKLSNKRVLKDHFISEIKEIRTEYRNCLSNLYSSNVYAKNVAPWFKLMNVKIEDLIAIISVKYKLEKKILDPFQNELREIITDSQDFIDQYKSDKPVVFSDTSKNLLIRFQQKNNHLFNDVIMKINDAK